MLTQQNNTSVACDLPRHRFLILLKVPKYWFNLMQQTLHSGQLFLTIYATIAPVGLPCQVGHCYNFQHSQMAETDNYVLSSGSMHRTFQYCASCPVRMKLPEEYQSDLSIVYDSYMVSSAIGSYPQVLKHDQEQRKSPIMFGFL